MTANTLNITQAAEDAKSKANALSMQMYHLIGIVKLAAFAAEARRTLEGIRELADYRPEIKQAIADHVSAMADWRERDDNSGEMLEYVARQLEEVNGEFTETVHGLAWAKKGGAA